MPTPQRPWSPFAVLPLVVLACLTVAAPGLAQEWARFRGPNGSGIAPDAAEYPVVFGPDRALRWRTTVRPGKSSPVLSRRHVFLTAFDEGDLYTQCFDRVSGRLVWERSERPARREDAHVLNEPSAATPVTDGENVYVFFRDLGVISYDAAGAVRWKHPMGPFVNRMGAVTSPIIAGESLVVVLDQLERSSIVALSLDSGAVQWKVVREEMDGWATPVLYAPAGQPAQIVTAGAGRYGGHAVGTGERLWTHNGLAPAIVASPVLAGDTVLGFGYGYDSTPPFSEALSRNDKDGDGRISLVECGESAWLIGIARHYGDRDGSIVEAEWLEAWSKVVAPSSLVAVVLERGTAGGIAPRELWRYEKSFVAVVPTPLVLDGLVYTIKNGGILTVLDAATGAVLRTARVGSVPASYSASPVATGGRIYFANEDGIVTVVRAGKDWEPLASNDLGEPVYATPALSAGSLYVRGAKSLFAFDGVSR